MKNKKNNVDWLCVVVGGPALCIMARPGCIFIISGQTTQCPDLYGGRAGAGAESGCHCV